MRIPKNVRRADAKKNAIKDSKKIEKVIGNITILASQILWGDNTTTRTISVYHTGAVRQPLESNYEEDLEKYEFDTVDAANAKYIELVTKYLK